MGPRLVRGRRPRGAGGALTGPRRGPWWFGPEVLAPAGEAAPFDIALLDRDDTLNVRVPGGYVTRPEELVMLPGAAEGVARLTRAGCRTVLVTNQRGVSRGLMSRADLLAVHARLDRELVTAGARLDGVAVCPHEEGTCDCRKPRDGLFREVLARAPWASAQRCVMIGDSPADLTPARALGMRVERVGADRGLARVAGELLA